MTQARQRVHAWLSSAISEGYPGQRLPTIRSIADSLQVSPTTVRAVTQQMCASGDLEAIQGKGIFVAGGNTGTAAAPHSKPSSVESLTEMLVRAINTGDIVQGEFLPPIKQTALSFGVSPLTAMKAYHALVHRGLVHKIGRRFTTGTVSRDGLVRTPRPVYAFIREFRGYFSNDYFRPAYVRFEEELYRYGYTVRYHVFSDFPDIWRQWVRDRTHPYGILVHRIEPYMWEQIDPQLQSYQTAAPRRFPPVVLDWVFGRIAQIPRGYHVLGRGNVITAGARSLMSFLQRKKIHSAAVIIDQERPDLVFTISSLLRLFREARNIDPAFEMRFVFQTSDTITTKDAFLKRYFKYHVQQKFVHFSRDFGFDSVTEFKEKLQMVSDTTKAFAAIARMKAWICYSNQLGAAGVQWLKDRSLKPGADVAVISLQNSGAFAETNLSFLDFELDRIGYLMAHAIIGDITLETTRKGFLRTRARVRERLTT